MASSSSVGSRAFTTGLANAMEPRGKIWFLLQFIIFCLIVLAPLFERAAFPLWLRGIGAAVLVSGIIIAVLGYRTLGATHSPWTNPREGGQFIASGIYSYIRHPIYTGWIIGTIGWELLVRSLFGIGVGIVLLIFYDFKSREEERGLLKRYTGYAAYRGRVKRFIPWVY